MDRLRLPGTREVLATLDTPSSDADACVVACPPHPQHGGRRTDSRLVAVADYLTDHGIACLRFDYGAWDEGDGEREDALTALEWASRRYDRLGLFGFSFGGAVALLAGAERDNLACVSALAPAARLPAGLDAVAVIEDITCPVQVVYAERDTTADWEPVVERARTLGQTVEGMSADHFFVGQTEKVGDLVGAFLGTHLVVGDS